MISPDATEVYVGGAADPGDQPSFRPLRHTQGGPRPGRGRRLPRREGGPRHLPAGF